MAPARKKSRLEQARQYLTSGTIQREDSDDELGQDDLPWEWIYEEETSHDATQKKAERTLTLRKRKAAALTTDRRIIGAKMGSFECKIGDAVLLKAEGNKAWVGIICELYDGEEEEDDDKMAKFMWFSGEKEIRNKSKKRDDCLENELYITTAFDLNPLTTIIGKANVVSLETFNAKYPSGQIKKSSKDYGKMFVCRRGCNTRTTTYTEEFKWEDIYKGVEDVEALQVFVDSHTKSTRKKQARPKTDNADLDDFVVNDEDGIPRTPKKRRRLNEVATPTSKRKDQTHGKFLTPTHKRIVIKKPLEFTPLGTRIISPSALSSPFQIARNQLHVSSVPAALPCREEEFSTVYSHLEAAITEGSGSCIYISGTPGTGKTATVREVVAQLNASVLAEELDDFIFVEINGMKVTDPHQSYSLLWEALRGDRVSPAHALELLEREFSTPSPRRVPCVVLMDELDQLVTKNQSVMYNFFNWPGLRHSRLIVLAVANTMDLPERTLSNKISSRLGLTRITFPGYTHDQLMQIIQSRLSGVPGHVVQPDAVQFAARKVAAVSGDARRALDMCRRAVEIAEAEAIAKEQEAEDNDAVPDTPSKSKSRRGAKSALPGKDKGNTAEMHDSQTPSSRQKQSKPVGVVTIATIKQAINEATSSPLQQYLRALPLASKLFLAALLARIRRTGVGEALMGDVVEEAKRLGLMSQLQPVQRYLLAENEEVTTKSASTRQMDAKAARALGLGKAALDLAEAGIVGVESRRGERVGRVRLGVGDEEVRLALGEDEEVKGLGFGS
ncbi:P-loop containing nucleoside triphosphate hydrolase protein [Mytilinidion resinicola]|uniref:Origin recognition complex subunit 1 n=1 Tax=Mytilinidion resinicola TaxID=574789 RepID=A0A6A6YZ32_9PEZI|nr:P-loop containing nucleoside triphosphate hydrolase protein [Mytilinidion resinicola]KAF2813217.1 P-loop containing nucleoside triphosphate hydrolase protein [Mytilinidion resinicola]